MLKKKPVKKDEWKRDQRRMKERRWNKMIVNIEIKIQGIYSLEQILSEAIRVDETHPNIIKKLDIEVLNESESLLSNLDTN